MLAGDTREPGSPRTPAQAFLAAAISAAAIGLIVAAAGLGWPAAATLAALVALRYGAVAAVIAGTLPLWRARREVAADPTNASAHYRLARALFSKERLSDAIKVFRDAIQLDPDLEITRPRETAAALVARHGRRDARFISVMCALASMDYLVEEARGEGLRRAGAPGAPGCVASEGAEPALSECADSLDAIHGRILALERERDSLAVPGEAGGAPPVGERAMMLDEKIRFMRRLAERIEELQRRIESGGPPAGGGL
jgi:tetratricopeptide (TPR) repeat protein